MKNSNTILGISIATFLAISILLITGVQDANASEDKLKFPNKLGFESKTCIVTSFANDNLSPEALAALDCKIKAWLDKNGNGLKYRIQIKGMELIDSDGDTQDDLYQLHIHKNTTGTAENPKGSHQLNVYREPAFDDDDLVVRPAHGVLKGIWDDGDENLSYGEPDNSHKLSDNLQLLCDGQIFAAGHGDVEDTPGHHAPYIKMLLEPTKDGQKICDKLGY